MLLMLTGSSCAGKTSLALAVATLIKGLAVHDFDDLGVPSNADKQWRQESLESWLQQAVKYQNQGLDLLLTGQSPLGEVLACPSATKIDGIAVCLIDVSRKVRADRLRQRDGQLWSPQAVEAFCDWAAWHCQHAIDPTFQPDAITDASWSAMRWDRWKNWKTDDPRWNTYILDTTDQSMETSVAAVHDWIRSQRELQANGQLPLAMGWEKN